MKYSTWVKTTSHRVADRGHKFNLPIELDERAMARAAGGLSTFTWWKYSVHKRSSSRGRVPLGI
jgi:hypothetical protein